MFENTFFNETLSKYVDSFGFIFKNIILTRTNGTKTQKQVVPITFGPTEHYIARNTVDPGNERPVSIQLPRLTYDLVAIKRDTNRQLNPLNHIIHYNDDGSISDYFYPVPYNLYFELGLKGRHIEDMYKITESIIPFFTPYFTIKAELIDNVCPIDIIINLEDINLEDKYQGHVSDNRVLEWLFTFKVSAWFFGPNMGVGEDGTKVIRWVQTDVYTSLDANTTAFSQTNSYPVFGNTAIEDIKPTDSYTIQRDIIEN